MSKIRKISSISGVITNSSTEIFSIWGEDALKKMIGCGVFRKYKKYLLYLKTEEDVMNFITESGEGYSHNYYRSMLNTVGDNKNLICLYDSMVGTFPDREAEILEFFKPEFIKNYCNVILYYDYRHNGKILKLLEENFSKDNYWDDNSLSNNTFYRWEKD